MNLQTFKADTMAEALAAVKLKLGSEAVILHTRTVQQRRWLGLRRHDVVEITAGRGINVQKRTGSHASHSSHKPQRESSHHHSAEEAAHNRTPRNAIEGSRMLLQTPAVANAAVLSISQEMSALKSMVKELVAQQRNASIPNLPENLVEHYRQLIENDVAEELAGEIIRSVQKNVHPDHLSNAEFIRAKIAEQLEKLLPVAGPIKRTKTTGPHVVALVGPTGVGKTTTIAKLAANLKLREKRKVGLITLDTYRIAAVEQLRKYAEIIGSTLLVVNSGEELRKAISQLQDCEYILIDTAGRSPKDTMKLNELKSLLSIARPDEVHLVISTTASQDCVELAIERFSDVRVDKIIFTKLDEAAHVGVVLNVVRKVNKNLSYVTTGQDVPDDIEVSHSRKLARLILGESTNA